MANQQAYYSKSKVLTLRSGAKVEKIVGEQLKEINKYQNLPPNGAILVSPEMYILPYTFQENEDLLLNFEYKTTDVFIVGFPKSGTTFLSEIVWTILHNADLTNRCDELEIFTRTPLLERSCLRKGHHSLKEVKKNLSIYAQCDPEAVYTEMLKIIPHPRVIKSHFYPSQSNPQMYNTSKMIYILRNPNDTFLSWYHFQKLYNYITFDQSLEIYTEGYVRDFTLLGTASKHIKAWWPYRNYKNIYFVCYETLIKSRAAEISKIASFIGKDLTEQQLSNVIERTTFETMKKKYNLQELDYYNNSTYNQEQFNNEGGFFREGKVGMAKGKLPPEIYEKLSNYFKEDLKDCQNLPYQF